jgi:hypothetical protein
MDRGKEINEDEEPPSNIEGTGLYSSNIKSFSEILKQSRIKFFKEFYPEDLLVALCLCDEEDLKTDSKIPRILEDQRNKMYLLDPLSQDNYHLNKRSIYRTQ